MGKDKVEYYYKWWHGYSYYSSPSTAAMLEEPKETPKGIKVLQVSRHLSLQVLQVARLAQRVLRRHGTPETPPARSVRRLTRAHAHVGKRGLRNTV